MTHEEEKIIHLLGDVWNKFLDLPIEHDSANKEFEQGIHALQNQIAARAGFRKMNSEDS